MIEDKALKKFLTDIRKTYGEESVAIFNDESSFPDVERVPTSSPLLNELLGGGIPRSRIIEIWGPESTGKTSLTTYIAGQFQENLIDISEVKSVDGKKIHDGNADQRYGVVVFIDVENALDPSHAVNTGLDLETLILCQPDNAQQALDLLYDFAASGLVDLIILDSVAALVSKQEIEGESGDAHMGLIARLMGQSCRRVNAAIKKTKTTVIYVNQIRSTMQSMGNPETTCVTGDTPIMIHRENSTYYLNLDSIFELYGFDSPYELEVGEYDVSNRSDIDLHVATYNEEANDIDFKRITHLVRKKVVPLYGVFADMAEDDIEEEESLMFKGSGEHRIYLPLESRYEELKNLVEQDVTVRTPHGMGTVTVRELEEEAPIFDMTIDGNHNYFANGILSHNTGGNALKFFASIRMTTRSAGSNKIMKGDDQIGILIDVATKKNKTAPPHRKTQLTLYYNGGFAVDDEWIDMFAKYGFIDKGGAGWYTMSNGTKIQGNAKVAEYFKDHPEEYNELKRQCLELLSSKPKRVTSKRKRVQKTEVIIEDKKEPTTDEEAIPEVPE